MVEAEVINIIANIKTKLEINEAHLTKLDSQIGDGDHGLNINRGFNAIDINQLENKSFEQIFKLIGMKLISTIGGASGPVYGTLFLEYAKITSNQAEITIDLWVRMNEAAIVSIEKRGGAKLGDKTLLDVLIPYTNELKATKDMLKATKIAHEKCEETVNYIATKGRASYLGERSIGHIDPGCASLVIMLEEVCNGIDNSCIA